MRLGFGDFLCKMKIRDGFEKFPIDSKHHPSKPARGTRGSSEAFSLIEVMVAVLILGIAVAGMVQGITTALNSSKESELQTTAALIAAGQIEALRAEGYLVDGETEGQCGEGLSLYQWKQTLTATTIKGLHEVDVEVEDSKTGKTIYELRTMLFEAPPLTEDESSPTKGSGKSNKKDGRKR
jgi:prepilin-type N-terminal cleavage/methylation domain-containing protein